MSHSATIILLILLTFSGAQARQPPGDHNVPPGAGPSIGDHNVSSGLVPIGDHKVRAWSLIGAVSAAHFATFRHPVKVAVIDDGFDLANPLWASHIAHNPQDIPGNNEDDDHNGKVDDHTGWDFGDNDEDVQPAKAMVGKESHGTRVLGVFWQLLQQLSDGEPRDITILPIKAVSDGHLNNYLKEGYKGIEYAIGQKADIIICSWSGPLIAPEEKAILEKAKEKGIIIIAAAGNFYAMQPLYPGATPSVINVAATTLDGHKLPVSNYGTFVDISAPGDSLLTYDPYNPQPDAYLSATSAATPVIGAIVTALRAGWPGLSPAAIERLLKNTATPLETANPLYAGNLGAGLVNVAAIRDALRSPHTRTRSVPASPITYNASAPGEFKTPQAYIPLSQLQVSIPVKITPAGRYPGIKFIFQPETGPTGAGEGTIRAVLFRDGRQTDTLIRRQQLKYPFIAIADSLYLYRAGPSTPPTTHHSGGVAFHGLTTGPAPPRSTGYWYYSALTIDSSTLYCGGTVDIPASGEGFIEDGSGKASYTGRNDCKWQLTAPAGKKIQLDFPEFDTEPKIDQVYIFNGNSTKDPILAIFSGHKLPPHICSWGNTVLVWFITNGENNYQGWKLHYKVIDAGSAR